MSSKQKNRKKPIETPLGQAPPPTTAVEQIVDLSIIKKPINTNIVGIKQLLSLPDNATNEVQNYVNYECDILYECRICRAIFRSLANFILHKRNYCTEKYRRLFNSEESGGFVIDADVPVTTSGNDHNGIDNNGKEQQNGKTAATSLAPVLDKLYKKHEIDELNRTILNNDLSNDVQNYNQTSNGDDCLILQKIDHCNSAVYQTLSSLDEQQQQQPTNTSLMKSEIMEIHGIFDNNQAVLGKNGKICDYETTKKLIEANIPKQDLICTECNFKFSTKKTLTSHIKYKHNKTCIVYPCPDCKETFANAWSVYRHLDKVHKRTSTQVKRMRQQVLSNAIRKEQEKINNNNNNNSNNNKKKNQLIPIKEDEENQWMNNLECDGDLRMCGGCGKKFERRAALQSHSQTCIRRIAVCNTINSKQQQKPIVTTTTTTTTQKDNTTMKPTTTTTTTTESTTILKGSAKRKARKLKLKTVNSNNNNNQLANVKIVDVSKIFNQKQETNNFNCLDTDSMLDILGISKQNVSNKNDNLTSSSSLSTTSNNDNNEIYNISDESCHSSPELFQQNDNHPIIKKFKSSSLTTTTTSLINDIDLADDSDENFLLKASPYMKRNEFKCISCQTYYSSRYQLLWHMSLHFSWYRYQCAKCPFMSFNKYDCADHAYLKHGTTINLIDSTVLPIPKWKIISMSHDFIKLDTTKLRERNVPKALKPKQLLLLNKQNDDDNNNNSGGGGDNRLETIILEDDDIDEMLDKVNSGDNNNDNDNDDDDDNNRDIETIELLDDEKDPLANENENVTTETETIKNEETVTTTNNNNNRPVRTRTRSYKTLQNDFIYDLGKVLKLNDNAIKNSLAKIKKK